MNDYLAAIDAGTGGVRCVIFDVKGNVVSQDYRETLTMYTPDGHAEQDPIQLMKGAWDAVRGAVIRGGIDASRIAGITSTGTQATFAPVDRDGNFLTNIIVWQDARGLSMFPWMRERLAARGMTEAELYRRTLRPMNALLAGAKLLWLREREPALYGRIHRLANPQAILLRAFGAEEVTIDPTDGGWWLCHDSATLALDPELIGVFWLDPGIFPRLCAPGEPVGRVTADAAERTGLKAGTPLYQGAVDQCCAALGAGNYGSAEIGTLCMGTAGVLMNWSEKPVPDPLGRYPVVCYPGGGFAGEIGVRVAASAFRWVRDMLYPAEAYRHDAIYRQMDAEAATVPIGSNGVCFLPLMAGSAYPKADESIRGGWIGTSLSTKRPALVRAALEGICYEMCQVLEESGQTFASIRLLGGAARSGLWNQMQADVYGCPVETIASQEASALGAVMIAACGAGLYPSLKEAVCGMTHIKHRYIPNPDNVVRYRESYEAWQSCVEDLGNRAFPALAKVRNGGV